MLPGTVNPSYAKQQRQNDAPFVVYINLCRAILDVLVYSMLLNIVSSKRSKPKRSNLCDNGFLLATTLGHSNGGSVEHSQENQKRKPSTSPFATRKRRFKPSQDGYTDISQSESELSTKQPVSVLQSHASFVQKVVKRRKTKQGQTGTQREGQHQTHSEVPLQYNATNSNLTGKNSNRSKNTAKQSKKKKRKTKREEKISHNKLTELDISVVSSKVSDKHSLNSKTKTKGRTKNSKTKKKKTKKNAKIKAQTNATKKSKTMTKTKTTVNKVKHSTSNREGDNNKTQGKSAARINAEALSQNVLNTFGFDFSPLLNQLWIHDHPTMIQARSWPLLLKKTSSICVAPTGSGIHALNVGSM